MIDIELIDIELNWMDIDIELIELIVFNLLSLSYSYSLLSSLANLDGDEMPQGEEEDNHGRIVDKSQHGDGIGNEIPRADKVQ